MPTPQGRRILIRFDDGSHNTALLPWFLLKIRSVWILDLTIHSGSLVWLFSPAWDAVKFTLPGDWLQLSFRGHWLYRFRSDDGSCSRTHAWQVPTYPWRRIPAFLPLGIKASRVRIPSGYINPLPLPHYTFSVPDHTFFQEYHTFLRYILQYTNPTNQLYIYDPRRGQTAI